MNMKIEMNILKDINPKTKYTVGNNDKVIDINPLIKGCILQFST